MSIRRADRLDDSRPNLLLAQVEELRSQLRSREANLLAVNSGTRYEVGAGKEGVFRLTIWEREVLLSYPDFQVVDAQSGTALSLSYLALVLYYMVVADGSPLLHRWIAFSELPDGRFYAQAFQSYTGATLARRFRDDQHAFELAARRAGGGHLSIGDAAYAFRLFPRVPLAVVFWQGDEDFPANFQILFDGSVSHYLPTDACALAGSLLTRKILSPASTDQGGSIQAS